SRRLRCWPPGAFSYLARKMSEQKPPKPLDYSSIRAGERGPSGPVLATATLCLVAGIFITGLGLAAFAKYYEDAEQLRVPSLVFASIGVGLCCAGMYLKRGKS